MRSPIAKNPLGCDNGGGRAPPSGSCEEEQCIMTQVSPPSRRSLDLRGCALILLAAWTVSFAALVPVPSVAQAPADSRLEHVTLLLKWMHGFQFAGYYAACEQGYYFEEGLDVTMNEPSHGKPTREVVLEGGAQYAVWGVVVLTQRLSGDPFVVLAVIFQHSPDIILSRSDSDIRAPSDLIGRSVMFSPTGSSGILVRSILINEGLSPDDVDLIPHTWSIDDLVDRRVDAQSAYITDQPYQMLMRGVEPSFIRPIDYGINFYGDCLITTEAEIEQHPERVAAFRRASIRGWEYAMSHVDEMIDLILTLPGVQERSLTVEHLRYEAERMQELILPKLVEIGHINPGRWQHIANTYVDLGMLDPDYSLEGLIYEPNPVKNPRWLYVLLGGLTGITSAALVAWVWNRQLRGAVARRTSELRESERLLLESQSVAQVGSYVLDIASGIWKSSPMQDNIFGIDEDYERSVAGWLAIVHPGDRQSIADYLAHHVIEDHGRLDREYRIMRRADGAERWVLHLGVLKLDAGDRPLSLSGTIQDITGRRRAEEARKKLQEQLSQVQKMESVGQLAGGVAHDFNNMLAVILGHTEMAMDLTDPTGPISTGLKEIHKAAGRSASLIRQLLAFARKQAIAPQVLDLNETIEGMLKMLRRLIGEDIDFVWRPGLKAWPVKMDPSQIDQILANLCVNARDAIEGMGKITIETGNAAFNQDYCDNHPGFVAGQYVLLAVSDNGHGMDGETVGKIFEPFFTTKEVGIGTGLGLATVYGIVRQNDGFIDVHSEPGDGTTLKIYLSRHTGPAVPVMDEAAEGPDSRGHETILLVEDEPAILKMAATMLDRLGYTVLTASAPGEAFRQAGVHAGEIHLLITDVVMPEMNGRNLAKNLLALYPGLKCLFMSGYTANVIAHRGVIDEGVNFIQKPFLVPKLARKVREVLDTRR